VTADSKPAICVAGDARHVQRRVSDFLMREARKRNRGRATFVIEFVGTAWHVLEAKPPVNVKL
jgi:hypothetical protein